MTSSSSSPNGHAAGRPPVRVALVGCGAVSRENLLPVLAGYEGLTLHVLVDRDEARARELAQAYGVPHVLTDADLLRREDVDGVILATPPAHHAPATRSLAAKGFHVLVEKPMAITAADAQSMVDAATQAGVVLSVGLYRRFLPSVQLLRELIARQEFGRPLSVDAEEGGPYGWPLATLDVLTRTGGGGGVLVDIGSHVVDVLLHVLDAAPTLERYQDNSRGGIETDCLLHAALNTPTGAVPLRLELSRSRELRGSIQVRCEHATLELMRGNFTEIQIRRPDAAGNRRPIQMSASWNGEREFAGYEAFRQEIHDWASAIATSTEPMLSGRSVVPVVRLIEEAYLHRAALSEPATDQGLTPSTPLPTTHVRKRVLVTGAGGFLGGRTVELLREQYGWDPVALVREPKSAARLARWPLDIRLGNICSRADVDRAVAGCDAVVHCAVGTSWQAEEVRRVTVDGTRIVAEAALAAGVKRFVHISSLFVHQREGVTSIDENTPLAPPASDSYGQNKLAAEQALAAVAAKGLSTVILRPTRIYGPFSRTFTLRPLQALTDGRLVIGGDADVPANMVYVDNVVAAIERALHAAEAVRGSAYLVNDPEQVSLRDFYGYFADASGATLRLAPEWRPDGDGADASALSAWLSGVTSIVKSSELRGLVRRIVYTDPIGKLPRRLWEASPATQQKLLRRFGADAAVIYRGTRAQASDDLTYNGEPAQVSSAKAVTELGLMPVGPRAETMAWTLEWARYARLLSREP